MPYETRYYTPVDEVFRSAAGLFINLIGIAVDLLPPQKTRGSDYQMTLKMQDHTTFSNDKVRVKLFRPRVDILPNATIGDVIVFHDLKLTDYNGERCALSSFKTTWRVITFVDGKPKFKDHPDEKVPHVEEALALKVRNKVGHQPSIEPTRKSAPATTSGYRGKIGFALLKAVQEGDFADLLVEVVKVWHGADVSDVYVTDYTKNDLFAVHDQDMASGNEARGTSIPMGKLTIKISCWGMNTTAAREIAQSGEILFVKNCRIKRDGRGNLEGSVYPNKYSNRPDIYVFKEKKDSRFIELKGRRKATRLQALQRQAAQGDSEVSTNTFTQAQEQSSDSNSVKSSSPAPKKPITKIGRENPNIHEGMSLDRPSKRRRRAEDENEIYSVMEANEQSILPLHRISFTTLSLTRRLVTISGESIFDVQDFSTIMLHDDNLLLSAPFECQKRIVKLRIVDFLPHSLTQFSQRKVTDGVEARNNQWIWNFTLIVVDGDVKTAKIASKCARRIQVRHKQALTLLNGLEACDLRADLRTLNQLREKLFLLWGDLEETKNEFIKTHLPGVDLRDVANTALHCGYEASKGFIVQNRPFIGCVGRVAFQSATSWQELLVLMQTRIADGSDEKHKESKGDSSPPVERSTREVMLQDPSVELANMNAQGDELPLDSSQDGADLQRSRQTPATQGHQSTWRVEDKSMLHTQADMSFSFGSQE